MPRRPVIIMGLRGSGKTTVGRRLAERLGMLFVDMDDRTARRLGAATAAGAIREHGLAAFRDAERAALGAALLEGPMVLALGGGTPTAPGAADLLTRARTESGAALIYLHGDAATLRARLAATDTASRPPLTEKGTLGEIEDIYLRRDPLFRSLATEVLETGGRTPVEIAAEAARRLDEQG